MASIWLSRVSRWLEALFNVKGGAVQFDINPSLQPVITWHDGVDSNPTAGWNRYCTNVFQAGVAAQKAAIRFRNPPGSNVISVFEKIICSSTAALADQPQVVLQANSTDFATAVVSQRMDPRGQLLPTLVATQGSNASVQGGGFLQGAFPAGGQTDFILTTNSEIVAAPGDSVTLWSNVLNQGMTGSFMWRERALQQSELT